MDSNRQALGLAVLGIALLIAVGLPAPASAAPEFTAYNPAVFKHEHAFTHSHTVSRRTLFGTCTVTKSATSLTGTNSSITTSTTLFEKCTAFGRTTKVRANSCHQLFTPGKKVSANKYEGSYDIICTEKGDKIEVEVEESIEGGRCLATIAAQEGVGPVYYENNTEASPMTITVNVQAKNLVYTTDDPLANCGVESGLHKNGIDEDLSEMTAKNEAEEQIDLTVTGE